MPPCSRQVHFHLSTCRAAALFAVSQTHLPIYYSRDGFAEAVTDARSPYRKILVMDCSCAPVQAVEGSTAQRSGDDSLRGTVKAMQPGTSSGLSTRWSTSCFVHQHTSPHSSLGSSAYPFVSLSMISVLTYELSACEGFMLQEDRMRLCSQDDIPALVPLAGVSSAQEVHQASSMPLRIEETRKLHVQRVYSPTGTSVM